MKEHKNMFFDKVSFPPGTQGLFAIAAPKCRVWGVGGYPYREKNIFLCSFLPILILLIPTKALASVAGEVNKANELYKQGKFDDSLKLYQEALDQDDKSPVVKYDLGTALYKKGDYAKALGYLEQAARNKNVKIKPRAEYNLGNVLYKSGMQKANTNVDEAIKSLQEALGHYGQTIAVDPEDRDAVFNQDFVKKEIERLKKKKQQQRENQRQKQKRQKQQQQQNNQSSQGIKQQENKQQNQQNQQRQQKQQNQQQQSESQAQKQQNARAQAEENQQELDRKQAQDLLEEYQENEEPKKLLNYMPKKIDNRPVLKDW